jgi:hypothetical protein
MPAVPMSASGGIAGHRKATLKSVENDPQRSSSVQTPGSLRKRIALASRLWHAAFVQTVEYPLDLRLINRIVAHGTQHGTDAADGKRWIER